MQINITENKKEIKEHGDFSFPVNVCIEKIQDYEQDSFFWHWHPEVELTLILSGKMEYRINDKTYIISEGEGLFGNCNTLHSGYMKDNVECTYLSITFHPRYLYGYENSILQTKYVDHITEGGRLPSIRLEKHVGWHREIVKRMEKIYSLSKDNPKDYEIRVHMLLMEIWHRIYQYYEELPEEEERPQKHMERLRKIITYLQDNYDQDISLEDVADTVNICKSECCRFFKKYMNMTIMEYVMYYRIQESLSLLKSGESVTNVSGMVGFSSPAYFGQIFKRYMKCTPREYKVVQGEK